MEKNTAYSDKNLDNSQHVALLGENTSDSYSCRLVVVRSGVVPMAA